MVLEVGPRVRRTEGARIDTGSPHETAYLAGVDGRRFGPTPPRHPVRRSGGTDKSRGSGWAPPVRCHVTAWSGGSFGYSVVPAMENTRLPLHFLGAGEKLCRLEDSLTQLRPGDELHSAWVLARRAELAHSETMALLADVRMDLLSSLLSSLTGDFADRGHLAHRARLAGRALRRWVDEAGSRLTPWCSKTPPR